MIEVLKVELKPDKIRIGRLKIKYYDLTIFCDLCLYKDEKLWVRMPEMWRNKEEKIHFLFWENPEKSDEFQKVVLNKVFETLGLTVEAAVKMRQDFFLRRKSLTKRKPSSRVDKFKAKYKKKLDPK